MKAARTLLACLMLAACVGVLGAPDGPTALTKPTESFSIDNNTFIDANQILMFVTNHGSFGRDLAYLFRADVGTWWPYEGDTSLIAHNIDGVANRSPLYAAGLWLGAVDSATGDTLVAISEYSSEFVPGPMDNGTFLPANPAFRIYKLYRDSLWTDPNGDYMAWPSEQGAPTDEWGSPIMYGRQMLWTVFNDADPAAHTNDAGETAPLGIEIQQSVWAGDTVGDDRIYYRRVMPVEQTGHSKLSVLAWVTDIEQMRGESYQVTFGDTLVTDTSDLNDIDTIYYFNWHLDNLTSGDRVLSSQLPDNLPRYTEGIGLSVGGDIRGFTNFEVVANAGGPLNPPEAGAAAWAGFPVPLDNDGQPTEPTEDQQATSDSRWLFHTADNGGTSGGGMYGDYEAFLSSVPWVYTMGYYDYEMRFTGSYGNPGVEGSYCINWDDEVFWVPFELWRIGVGTPENPDDDVRMIPVMGRDGGENTYGLEHWGSAADGSCEGSCEHSVSDGDDDPWTDAVYWYLPEDESPGEAGYLAIEAQMLAGTMQIWMLPYSSPLNRTVLVSWDGGKQPPFEQMCPERGTVFRITTCKPETPYDTFTFVTETPPYYTGTLEGSTIYLEYKLFNKGEKTLKDLYIGLWNDPDLGSASDDLVGCDTLNDIWFCYNSDNDDGQYGTPPPALGFKVLYGPVVPSPSDTAYFDGNELPDFANMPMAAFVDIPQGTLNHYSDVYVYLQGRYWHAPYVYDGDTLTFWHSGDPVAGTGDLDEAPADRRMVASCGPLDLRPGDSQYVLIRMAVGLGDDNLGSITALKEILNEPFDPLEDPFSGQPPPVPATFYLRQNYPNPFNPSTRIEFTIPQLADVTIDVYNILGQRVRKLFNRKMPAGTFFVDWDGTNDNGDALASGLYLYRLRAGGLEESKKMILLKR